MVNSRSSSLIFDRLHVSVEIQELHYQIPLVPIPLLTTLILFSCNESTDLPSVSPTIDAYKQESPTFSYDQKALVLQLELGYNGKKKKSLNAKRVLFLIITEYKLDILGMSMSNKGVELLNWKLNIQGRRYMF